MTTETRDADLLVAAARGDERAFEEFYRRWLPIITAFHSRRAASREAAFDLTAETFAAVVVACGDFDPSRGPAVAWLYGIAAHKLNDSLRRERVAASARRELGWAPLVVEDADLLRVEELASNGAASLERLLDELPPTQRVAIRGRVLAERSYAELAHDLSCSEEVIRQRVHRGLRRLKEKLEESA